MELQDNNETPIIYHTNNTIQYIHSGHSGQLYVDNCNVNEYIKKQTG